MEVKSRQDQMSEKANTTEQKKKEKVIIWNKRLRKGSVIRFWDEYIKLDTLIQCMKCRCYSTGKKIKLALGLI